MPKRENTTLSVPVGPRDHVHGTAKAAVTLVEYGDYQCPDCGRVHPIVREIQRRLGATLRFVFRNFPLTHSHAHALQAAEAAESAAAQGRFWEMHDMLFEHQRKLDIPELIAYADALGLEARLVREDLRHHTHVDKIREDVESGMASGVNGTPTFYINGARYDDSTDLESLFEAVSAGARRTRPRSR